jgi:transcriptional regulator with XRE-family HTH domain
MDLADRIRIILTETGMSQKAFAESLNVTASYISKVLHTASGVSNTTAMVIEKLYGYTKDWLLNGTEPKKLSSDTQQQLSALQRKILFEIESMDTTELKLLEGFINSLKVYEEEKMKYTNNVIQNNTIYFAAASGDDDELIEIWNKTISEQSINGKLWITANNKNTAGKMQCYFKFAQYHSEPPFYMQIQFKTPKDNKNHSIALQLLDVNSEKHQELIIKSELHTNICYEDGITNLKISLQEIKK